MIFSALLNTKPHPGIYIFAAILIGVIAVCVIPAQVAKRKMNKYKAENTEAAKDAALMFARPYPSCPICKKGYTASQTSRRQIVEPSRLISGTFVSGLDFSVTDKHYSCGTCGYRYTLSGRYERTTEYYQDAEYKLKTDILINGSGKLTKEEYTRVVKAIEYHEKVDLKRD